MPTLISKFVFNRLGAPIDLDDNNVEFKRFPGKTQSLFDLKSGHVAIRLLKDGDQVPEVPQEALDICMNGQEVTIVDSALRDSM